MGQNDLTEKSLEFFQDVFADTINALLYQGEQVVLAENLQAAPTETLYKSGKGILRNQFHDVSKYEMKNGSIKVQYTLENETTIKSRNALRKAGYQGAVYREQYDGDVLYPFISLMLYWGKRHWRAPRSIQQLFEQNEVWEKNKEYIDNVQLHIFEMAHLPKEIRNYFHSDMRIVVDYLAERDNYVPTQQKIVHLEALILLLGALTGDERYEEILSKLKIEEREKGGIGMCELLDKYENRGLERGREEGIEIEGNRISQLSQKLLEQNRIADLIKALENVEYKCQLYRELGIV